MSESNDQMEGRECFSMKIDQMEEDMNGIYAVEAVTEDNNRRDLFLCSDCDFFSTVLRGVKSHKKSCTGKRSFAKRIYICSNCNFSTNSDHEMKTHEMASCDGVCKLSVQCQTDAHLCGPTCSGSDKVSIGCQTDDPNQSTTCMPLVVIARASGSMETDDEGYAGLVCKESVSCQTDDVKFVEDRKKDERIDCPHCSYSTTNKHNFKIHEKIHTGEKPHRCSYCDKGFTLKSNLTSHIRIHTGQRPYTCDVCNKSFATKSVLDRHKIRWHTDERPYVCEICFMGFKFKTDLNHHKKTHTYG